MAFRINQYQQQTVPNTLGVVPRAEALRPSGAMAEAGVNLARGIMSAAQSYANLREARDQEARRQEEENAKVWTAATLADAASKQQRKMAEMQNEAPEGAPGFFDNFEQQFDEYEQELLSIAPNETSRRFLQDGMMRMRVDLGGRAVAFEVDEGRRYRVNTTAKAADSIAATVAADPARLPVMIAEQRAVIEALDAPPEQRRALLDDLNAKVGTAAVLGEVERDPVSARAKLAARLGVPVESVAGPSASAPSRDPQVVQGKYEAIGSAFGFVTTSTVRSEAENKAVRGVANSQHLEGRGTARDWSVRGKTPEQIAAFVAALRAEGFEVITKQHGTGPHIHAELPPERAQPARTAEQAAAEKPEGERVGDMAYDLLTVPQVVSLLGTVNSEIDRQQSQMRSLVAAREQDDLAAYGDGKMPPQPLTAQEFISAYGGVEGSRRWQRYSSARQFASEMQGLATKSPAEIQAILNARQPQAGEGYAAAAQQYGVLAQAAQRVVAARNDDPVAFARANGLVRVQPLNFQDQDAMAAELKNRMGVAETMNRRFGTRYTLLENGEAAQLAALMGQMTAPEKSAFLQTVRSSVTDPAAYQSIMGQLRPDSPVTSTAGSIMAVGGDVTVGRGGMFSDAPRASAQKVAQTILMGEDLLNPSKGDKASDGKPKFPMPPDADMRATWAEYVGTAYAGSPETEADSYQAFRAYYAAEVAQSGDYSGAFNEDAAKRAAAAVTGGVVTVPGNYSQIVLPWGQDERYVLSELERNWRQAAAANGYGSVPFESITLQTVGDGVYAVNAGAGPLRGKDGQPLYLRVNRMSPTGLDENGLPTAPNIPMVTVPAPGGGR